MKITHTVVGGGKVRPNETVALDHTMQTFAVQIRSLQGVHPQTLKRLIEAKYEVTEIKQVERNNVVIPPRNRDF